eukprot:jgi/Orpsp1_1/1176371/evm.model.c7180000057357.1
MAFKIPSKNKKKRKLNTSTNTTRKTNTSKILNIPNHSLTNNNNISSNSSSEATPSTSKISTFNSEKIINNKEISNASKNSLLNNPLIPDKLKKLYQIFQIINKYYTLKQSRNTELFVFENYKSIIENELKCEVEPVELAQISGISPNNFKLQYLPINQSFIPNTNDILTSPSFKKEVIENHSIVKKEKDSSIEAIALIIHLEGHFKRIPRKDGSQILLKYGQLLKERNDRVNNDFKIFYITIKRKNKNLDEELAKFKLSPMYEKYINNCKALLEKKKKEEELEKKRTLGLIKTTEEENQDSVISFRSFIDGIKNFDFYEGQMVYEHIANPRLPKYDYKPISEYTNVLNMLKRVMGIEKLYSHQMKAIYHIWQ